MTEIPTPPDMTEYRARQRGRNRALGLVLVFFAVLFFVITLVKIGGNAG